MSKDFDYRKPVNERETIEIDGVQRRLGWIAENQPDILIKRYGQVHKRMSVYESALIKVGWTQKGIANRAKELGYDPGVYAQTTGIWPDE